MDFISLLLNFSQDLGYVGIYLLMTAESTIIPIPSELVIPPAAYLAYQGEMSMFIVVLAGILGSVTGALINYGIARLLGRPLIYAIAQKHYMKYLFLTLPRLHKSEQFFLRYGNVSTFVGRLIIGIRHLISIPAGFVKMPFVPFVLYTSLGSFVWISILALCGYFLGANIEIIKQYALHISLSIAAVVIIGAIIFYSWKRRRSVF